MSFVTAALIVVGLLAVVLALACYHLLARLARLEAAVLGGLTPPSRRLTREQFEQRFSRALARSRLAGQVQSGVVLVVGAEIANDGNEIAAMLDALDRTDGLLVLVRDPQALSDDNSVVARFSPEPAPDGLGVATTPWVFVVDQARITASHPIPDGSALVHVLGDHT